MKATWDEKAWTTPSFAERFRVAVTPAVQQATCRKFVQMAKQVAAGTHRLGELYRPVRYLGSGTRELYVDHRWRGIVREEDERLILYAVGDHNMIPRELFTPADLRRADGEARIPFADIVCQGILEAPAKGRTRPLLRALDARWLYDLDSEQNAVVQELAAPLLDSGRPPVRALVTGGPGTGKTVILTQLASLYDWSREDVALVVSDSVAEYLSTSLGAEVLHCRTTLERVSKQTVVLVDDPKSWRMVERAFATAAHRNTRLAVVATDLAQVQDVVSDNAIRVFCGGQRVDHRRLKVCYRQTQGVGEVSLKFLRHISRHFTKHINATEKDNFARSHRLSVESANEMSFASPGGEGVVQAKASIQDIQAALHSTLSYPLWTHWRPYCLVIEQGVKGSRAIADLFPQEATDVISFTDTERLRGVEYQHVFMVLTRGTLLELTVDGREGLSSAQYIAARNMRIPFTRATDSIRIFGVEGYNPFLNVA